MLSEENNLNYINERDTTKSSNTNTKLYKPINTFTINEDPSEPPTNEEATNFLGRITGDDRRTVKKLKQSKQNQNCLSYEIKFNGEKKFIVDIDVSNTLEQQKQDFILSFKINNYQDAIKYGDEGVPFKKIKEKTLETSKEIPTKVQNIIDKSNESTVSVHFNTYNEMGKVGLNVNDSNFEAILENLYKKSPHLEEIDLEGNEYLTTIPDIINKFSSLKTLSFEYNFDITQINKIENKSQILFKLGNKEYSYKEVVIDNKKIGLYVGITRLFSGLKYFMFTDEGEKLVSLKFGRFKLDGTKLSVLSDNQENSIMSYKITTGRNSNYGAYDIEKYETISEDHKDFIKNIAIKSGFTGEVDLGRENQKDWKESEIQEIKKKKKERTGSVERNIYELRDKNINKEAWYAFEDMFFAMKKDGLNIGLSSTYRDIDRQTQTFFNREDINHYYPDDIDLSKQLNTEEKKIIETEYLERCEIAAPPGYSEHHTGKAFDILGDRGRLQGGDNEFKRLQINASKYGFMLSYPDPKNSRYEPWHWLYVGKNNQ